MPRRYLRLDPDEHVIAGCLAVTGEEAKIVTRLISSTARARRRSMASSGVRT